MSSLWTPDGERPIRREAPTGPPSAPPSPFDLRTGPPESGPRPAPGDAPEVGSLDEEDDEALMQAEMEQLASTPAEAVVAGHALGLFNLAGLHLFLEPPQLTQARLAIDAFAALVEGLAGRLGPDEAVLVDGLAKIRMAYVQVSGPKTQTTR